jgi:hypothetical protein
MNLGAFHALVSSTVKRGTTLDALIPDITRQAARWLERNYTFQYMHRYVTFSLDPTAGNPRAVPFPSVRVKSIRFVKLQDEDGLFHFMEKADPRQLIETETAIPTHYWLDAFDNIWFNNTPDKVYPAEMDYASYTDWVGLSASSTPWLTEHADDVLLALTVLLLGPVMRDDAMMARYKILRDEGLRTLLLSEEELESTNTNEVMQYGRTF